jgi:hypothetical protein
VKGVVDVPQPGGDDSETDVEIEVDEWEEDMAVTPRELTEEEEEILEGAWAYGDELEVLVEAFEGQRVSRGKMATLKDGVWLNDEVIGFYICILNAQNKLWAAAGEGEGGTEGTEGAKRAPRCFCFNTFFYTQLTNGNSYNYKAVRRYAKRFKVCTHTLSSTLSHTRSLSHALSHTLSHTLSRTLSLTRSLAHSLSRALSFHYQVDLLEMDKIIVPIHVGLNHWCLAVIHLDEGKFVYYDALSADNFQCLEVSSSSGGSSVHWIGGGSSVHWRWQ